MRPRGREGRPLSRRGSNVRSSETRTERGANARTSGNRKSTPYRRIRTCESRPACVLPSAAAPACPVRDADTMPSHHMHLQRACARRERKGQSKGRGRRKRERSGRSGRTSAPSPRTHGCESSVPISRGRGLSWTPRFVKICCCCCRWLTCVRMSSAKRRRTHRSACSWPWGPSDLRSAATAACACHCRPGWLAGD
ncbi:hypothetical protein L226DRAFT_323594 [Lentinus tigrinus ALCF2SS1-7]|uniref:Uncharacterized protein n=1 Tax=Lentinus tigrinus ALCF2SS1-6 TaxID=1328759 RepID=A0A5C2SGH9_9APHY|nr:hypothetical protein L227DRAFT_435402 [Lentinus tigrinus ALCF2SS1-6]RPD77485.1 hypothetical protein L226DRAFT_323594 [Lentinus tigrinus ALCF2SS1-7]